MQLRFPVSLKVCDRLSTKNKKKGAYRTTNTRLTTKNVSTERFTLSTLSRFLFISLLTILFLVELFPRDTRTYLVTQSSHTTRGKTNAYGHSRRTIVSYTDRSDRYDSLIRSLLEGPSVEQKMYETHSSRSSRLILSRLRSIAILRYPFFLF